MFMDVHFLFSRRIYGLSYKGYIDATNPGMVGYVHRMDNISRHLGQLILSHQI